MYNKLLTRQLRKVYGDDFVPDEKLLSLLHVVNDTYEHYEKDRKLIEQTMELNSAELTMANKKLRAEAEEYRITFNKLSESLQSLQDEGLTLDNTISKSLSLIDIAKMIQQESTHRIQAEKELKSNLLSLEKKNQELDQFAYVVSHDLKAPLRAISSLAEWIAEDSADHLTDDSRNNLELLRGRVNRMENLIHGILAYSKAGKFNNDQQIVNIRTMLNEILDSLNPAPHFKIEIDVPEVSIKTPAIKLSQVLANIISNAIKYNDKPLGEIKIRCHVYEDMCQFEIADNGPGIEKEFHNRIFQIFQTLAARDEFESTGIGLAIVKKIIEEQNGKIWVESELNKGSRFSFTWPTLITSQKESVS